MSSFRIRGVTSPFSLKRTQRRFSLFTEISLFFSVLLKYILWVKALCTSLGDYRRFGETR
jgi:hypothetical protein